MAAPVGATEGEQLSLPAAAGRPLHDMPRRSMLPAALLLACMHAAGEHRTRPVAARAHPKPGLPPPPQACATATQPLRTAECRQTRTRRRGRRHSGRAALSRTSAAAARWGAPCVQAAGHAWPVAGDTSGERQSWLPTCFLRSVRLGRQKKACLASCDMCTPVRRLWAPLLHTPTDHHYPASTPFCCRMMQATR